MIYIIFFSTILKQTVISYSIIKNMQTIEI